jgi:hypothetical protein
MVGWTLDKSFEDLTYDANGVLLDQVIIICIELSARVSKESLFISL